MGDGTEVVIPENALGEATMIRIAVVENVAALPPGYASITKSYAFTPHGLRFSAPVALVLPLSRTSSEATAMRLDDEHDSTWSFVAGAAVGSRVIEIATLTFSVYQGVTPSSQPLEAGVDAASTDATTTDAAAPVLSVTTSTAYDAQSGLNWTRTTINGPWSWLNNSCNNLSLEGHDDWRLPTPDELDTLITPGANPTYDANALVIASSVAALLSNAFAPGDCCATTEFVAVSLATGEHTSVDQGDALCVRGRPLNEGRFMVSSASVADLTTSLVWQRRNDPTLMSWSDAQAYCGALTEAGISDWRLPTFAELEGLFAPGASPWSLDVSFATADNGPGYWTSTPADAVPMAPPRYFTVAFDQFSWTRTPTRYPDPPPSLAEHDSLLGVRCVVDAASAASGYATMSALSDETLLDSASNLTWTRSPRSDSWSRVNSQCNNLSLEGHDDWRTPSPAELNTLIHLSQAPTYDQLSLLLDTMGSPAQVASNEIKVVNVGYDTSPMHRFVDLGTGLVGWSPNSQAISFCVRGPQPAPTFSGSTNTVVDSATSLIWQRTDAASALTWTDGQAYCAALDIDGMAGWRMPTAPELQRLVVPAEDPLIDPAFTGTDPAYYWSSTYAGTIAVTTDVYYGVSFATGEWAKLPTHQGLSDTLYGVRCVHD